MQVKKSIGKVYFLSFGLNTSSREYPISVKLTATSPIIKPGGTIHHQAPLEKPPQVCA